MSGVFYILDFAGMGGSPIYKIPVMLTDCNRTTIVYIYYIEKLLTSYNLYPIVKPINNYKKGKPMDYTKEIDDYDPATDWQPGSSGMDYEYFRDED